MPITPGPVTSQHNSNLHFNIILVLSFLLLGLHQCTDFVDYTFLYFSCNLRMLHATNIA